MIKDFINDVNYEDAKPYNPSFLVTIAAYDGKRKLDFARLTSSKLKTFLLSNDYVRNYYLSKGFSSSKVEDLVRNINEQRLKLLKDNKISVVFDANFNNDESYERVLGDGYQVIKVKIETNDVDNVREITKRNYEPSKVIKGVIGDKYQYESSYDENTYYEIKRRKQINLPDECFYYVIKDYETEEEFNNKAVLVIGDIEKRFNNKVN